eukprot:gnl/MRDRNA2_/MRDRNA2_58806_c0_seq1.p1 gnl/MRDRNA2_/MRDRNA2_58806_c0~~gnl/MRDRNA2_/MRDRNA2_58806_c0_seq1.p1  ORF type:complete len:236 (+),score=51.08 gnl/MRDRNA2_/MRDRNA2_58806_c0_seq1:54-710(+)
MRLVMLPASVALCVACILTRAALEGEDGWDRLLQNSPGLCDFSFEYHDRLGYVGMMALQRPDRSQNSQESHSNEADCDDVHVDTDAHTVEHEEPAAVKLANEALKIVGLELWEADDPDDGIHDIDSRPSLKVSLSQTSLPMRGSADEAVSSTPNEMKHTASTAGGCAIVDHCEEHCTGGHRYRLRSKLNAATPASDFSRSHATPSGPDHVALPHEFTE